MRKQILGMIVASLMSVSSDGFAQEDTTRTRLVIETDSGSMTVELYNETPMHRDNFIKLASAGFYDGIAFHRVIDDFMIQGGNPATKEGAGPEDGPGYTVPPEINGDLIHKKGALCAARKPDQANPQRASSGSQFYIVEGKPFSEDDLAMFEDRINHDIRNIALRTFFGRPENKEYLERLQTAKKERNQEQIQAVLDEVNPMIDAWLENKKFRYSDTQREVYGSIGGAPHLDMQYTVFGEVIDGFDVIDRIAACKKKGELPDPAIRMTIKVVE